MIRSTTHLRSIITERTLTADQLTQILTGMCTQRGKARHLAARPAASVAHMRGASKQA
ncbi:hypothetical protein [Nonomuraea turcica]|uniref:hypothetical protein n=1 Tax=Nonomuraea sp. G32 TaxID=3067274 RepID=UPI00273C34C6|nr:hypothetical protein [Nonomuraea sp. G32]MDP4505693.1 hypothetical protein [Nonomuraea sp. G32]